jgi:hypothetical protein
MISFYDVDGRMGLKNVWDLIDWDKHRQTVSRIQTRIVKAVKKGLKERVRGLQRLLSNSLAAKFIAIKRVISSNENNCRVWQHALAMLEPDEVKISCPVLRGLGTGNSPRLPGTNSNSGPP